MMSPFVLFVFFGLLAWVVYIRIRRNIGKQKIRPRVIRIYLGLGIIFTLFILRLAFVQNPYLALGLIGGLVLGGILGKVGSRRTKFEETAEGHIYTPDTRIGVALSLLFTGRIIYRLWLFRVAPPPPGAPPQLLRSPLTLFMFGSFVGYYLVYYTGLFAYTRDKMLHVKRPFWDWVRSRPTR